jgi:hypothetical protein
MEMVVKWKFNNNSVPMDNSKGIKEEECPVPRHLGIF